MYKNETLPLGARNNLQNKCERQTLRFLHAKFPNVFFEIVAKSTLARPDWNKGRASFFFVVQVNSTMKSPRPPIVVETRILNDDTMTSRILK